MPSFSDELEKLAEEIEATALRDSEYREEAGLSVQQWELLTGAARNANGVVSVVMASDVPIARSLEALGLGAYVAPAEIGDTAHFKIGDRGHELVPE